MPKVVRINGARVAWTLGLLDAVRMTVLLGGASAAISADVNAPKSTHCAIETFTKSPSEHTVVELEKPLRVRSVEGVITSQGGGWPEGVVVLFELRSTRGAEVRHVRTDHQGAFKVPDVPPGEYCFKATADGWQSAVGAIVVTKAADPAARVSFEMLLGV